MGRKAAFGASMAIAWLAVALPLRSARAEDKNSSAADKARADALFAEGKALMQAERYVEACPKFAASNAVDPGVGAMLWQGECEERANHPAAAWRSFAAAERMANERSDARQSVARDRKALLDVAVTRVAIEANLARVAHVRLDGAEDEGLASGREAAIDPGPHAIVVERNDGTTWSANFAPHAGEAIALHPVFVADRTAPEGPLALPLPSEVAAAPSPERANARPLENGSIRSDGGDLLRLAGIAGSAAGLVAIGAGLYLGSEAKTNYDDTQSRGHCTASNLCDAEGLADRAHATSLARDATVFVAAGAGATAVGVVVAIKWWNVQLAPTAGRSSAALTARGTF